MIDINELTLEEKIGQLFLIGLEEKNITAETLKMVEEYKIGGFILYKKNYNNYTEMLEIINELKRINQKNRIPLFIAIDQEGGRVNRMPKDFLNLKSPKNIAMKCNLKLIRNSIDITSEMLLKTGINMNIAPVLDIQKFNDTHPIGDRCYGKNKEDVCKYGVEAMMQMQKNNLISVIKHFPGHGATKTDSHYGLPIVNKSIEQIEEEDMVPFIAAINNGADSIMVGHLILKAIDKIFPVSLSNKIIIPYLREKLNFNGIIITDDIKMQAISLFYGPNLATKRALTVGNDIVMMRLGYKKEKKIIDKLSKNKHIINNIDEKVSRIIKLKEKYNISDNPVKGCNIEEINYKINKLNSLFDSK